MGMINGFHIDPTTQTITQVQVEAHKLDDIYKHIRAECFDTARLSTGDSIYVDDEGLLNGAGNTYGMFIVKDEGYRHPLPLAGHGLVLGCDAMGNSVDAKITLDDLQTMIEFATIPDIRRRAQAGEFGR